MYLIKGAFVSKKGNFEVIKMHDTTIKIVVENFNPYSVFD